MNFSCVSTYTSCRIIIKRDGVTVLNTTSNTGGYHTNREFDYGAGNFEITVNAYRQGARGGVALGATDTASITIVQPEIPVNRGTTNYFYDANGRLDKVEELGGATTDYEYDDADNRTSKTTTK